jgi:phosphate/phosphite/phosphonate ABC transporter binding protein
MKLSSLSGMSWLGMDILSWLETQRRRSTLRRPVVGIWVRNGLIQVILAVAIFNIVPSTQAQELKFGFAPGLNEVDVRAEVEPFIAHLSGAIGRKVSLYVANDERDLRVQMEAGVVDVGSFSPLAYVEAARGGKIRAIAQSAINGSTTYPGIIIKRFDSHIESLADLEGKRLAFVDSNSVSGFVYPRAMLVDKGVDLDRFFKEMIFAGSHEKVISAVLLGTVHAGATDDAAVAAAKVKGLPTFDLEVVAKTEPIPYDAIAVRVGLDDVLVRQIHSALLGLASTAAGRDVILRSNRKLTGYKAADDSLFDGVRRAEKVGSK